MRLQNRQHFENWRKKLDTKEKLWNALLCLAWILACQIVQPYVVTVHINGDDCVNSKPKPKLGMQNLQKLSCCRKLSCTSVSMSLWQKRSWWLMQESTPMPWLWNMLLLNLMSCHS
ncbi:unnamed protein product [Staurois parvus]|uniref:Uncharacterized protein n=1 Tax=Staurois parvus TaxID=386267 RepID=A0ABN9BLM5_9NEOB|nr:unnamed protein product [Staurois parvus]